MQKSELEKIKRKVMDEWIRKDISCEEECVCDVAVEIAIRKTAERIFSEIEDAYYGGSVADPNSDDFFENKLEKLKKEFLGE